MTDNEILFGEAKDVAEFLNEKNEASLNELQSAIINALNRINSLERQVNDLTEKVANNDSLKH